MRKAFSFISLLLTLLLLIPLSVSAASAEAEARDFIQGILKRNGAEAREESLQQWIDGSLSQQAGISSEWYVLALSQWKSCNFDSYERALLSYLKEHNVTSASTRLKYALCLAATGSTDSYISKTMNDSIGKQGLMSWVFGLHLLNNGYQSTLATAEDVKSILLSLQCKDGGWSIPGEEGEVDATAMTIQALAPYRTTDPQVDTAINRGLRFLSQIQQADGGFSSYGVLNPESSSQVLLALTALELSYEAEPDFQKNGNTLWDGILRFRKADGTLSHSLEGQSNDSASSQAFLAAVSVLRKAEGKGSLFLLDHAQPESVKTAPKNDSSPEKEAARDYRLPATVICILAGGLGGVVMLLRKRGNPKNFLALGLAMALGIVLIWSVRLQSAEEYYQKPDPKENAIGSVTVSIRCDLVAGKASHLPEDGTILSETEWEIREGDSVYTVLTEVAKSYRIQIENNGTASFAYVTGIQYLYESDYGDLSGWVYLVNGKRPSVGAGEYLLQNGDRIEWHYSLNLGEDLSSDSDLR